MKPILIRTNLGVIEIVDESSYSFDSADNTRSYFYEKNLAEEYRPSSIHGVLLDGQPIAVFGNAAGASVIHEHSAIFVNERLYLAIGDSIVCMKLQPFEFLWLLEVDPATCFGVYHRNEIFLSHGEISIARFSEEGKIIWSSGGADIFSEGFALHEKYIQAVDFNRDIYRFDYASGKLLS